MERRPARAALVLALALLSCPALAADPPQLVKARQLYNLGQFAQAIAAAMPVRTVPALRDGADLIIGRARLELYRQTATETDLVAAREALRTVRPDALTARDRLELITGLAEVLYYENAFSAAASLFELALAAPQAATDSVRERLFDWWASAIDRHAQTQSPGARLDFYPRLLSGALAEMKREPATAAAIYWQVAALVAMGYPDDAYAAAQAGWIRVGFNPAEAPSLRADLDRLVRDGVIPDRARRAGGSEPERTAETYRADWERFKTAWTSK